MSRFLSLIKTEPALVTNAVQAMAGIIVAFGAGLTTDQTGAILAVTAAVLTAITAAMTRPLQVSAFTGLATSAAVLAVSFGVHLPAGGVASVNLLITALFAVLTRAQVTPVATLHAHPGTRPVPVVPPAPVEPSKM